MLKKFGACAPRVEQALNGNGTSLDPAETPVGGNTRKPAAVTGRHFDAGKLAVCLTPSRALTVFPLPSVTTCTGWMWLKIARLPTWWPDRFTAVTNGKPSSVQACPD